MNRYRQIIFDVDDTLIDFAQTENSSLKALFAAHHWPLTTELRRQYHAYNQGLWRQLEQGKISYAELSWRCFHDFIQQHFHQEIDGLEVMAEYRSYFAAAHSLLPGVKDSLKYAKRQGYQLAVLSNGEQYMQNKRLRDAGINDYFDLVITSEEAGFSKPDPHIFDFFFSHSQVGPSETIFFGDGLQSDILGAEQYGFASIWYNHRHHQNTLDLHPLAEVTTYAELVKLIQNNFI